MEEYIGLIDDKIKHICILARRLNSLGLVVEDTKMMHIELRRQMVCELTYIKDLLVLCDKDADKFIERMTTQIEAVRNMNAQ